VPKREAAGDDLLHPGGAGGRVEAVDEDHLGRVGTELTAEAVCEPIEARLGPVRDVGDADLVAGHAACTYSMGAMESQLEFARVTVAGGPAVELCVDPGADDPVAPWLLEHGWIDEPVMRAFQDLLRPGARVLDLGSHLGLFSLPAAALGAEVIAVDGNAEHVRLLREAARRNGFEKLDVVHAAVSDGEGPVEFVERSIHGHLRVAEDGEAPSVSVPAITVEELLERCGWDSVDLIKLDIEGGEIGALRGMGRLHAAGARPAMVFECNASMLPLYGGSICRLRKLISELGYELLMIDHLRPGTLIESPTASAVQPETVCDYVAVAERPAGLDDQWEIEGPLSLEQTTTRLLDTAASPTEGYRRYAAELICEGPGWLRRHPLVAPAQRALEIDPSHAVRTALEAGPDPSPAAEHAAEAAPAAAGRPDDVAVLATGVAIRDRGAELERAGEPLAEELLLSGLSVHLRGGQLLAVVADDPDASAALLRVLAAFDDPALGDLEFAGQATLVDGVTGLEPGLDLAENMIVFGAFLGCDVRSVSERAAELATRAGVGDRIGQPLADAGQAVAARLALCVALECAEPDLLLLDSCPLGADPGFLDWVAARVASLRERGGAVAQVIQEPPDLVGPADRALAIAEGRVVACGNPEAIFEDAFAGAGLVAAGVQ